MIKNISLIIICIFICNQRTYSQYEKANLIAEWNFDSIESGKVEDLTSGILDSISGYFDIIDGVVGKAIKCDGFTTSIIRDGDEAPVITGPFTIQAWIAPQASPVSLKLWLVRHRPI